MSTESSQTRGNSRETGSWSWGEEKRSPNKKMPIACKREWKLGGGVRAGSHCPIHGPRHGPGVIIAVLASPGGATIVGRSLEPQEGYEA